MTNETQNKLTSIQVSTKTRKRLQIMKQQLEAKNLEEVIERILKIVPASELKQKESIKNGKNK